VTGMGEQVGVARIGGSIGGIGRSGGDDHGRRASIRMLRHEGLVIYRRRRGGCIRSWGKTTVLSS